MKIRNAGPGDIDQLIEVQSACALSPWTRDGYRDEIARPDSVVILAEDKRGSVVGFLTGRLFAPMESPSSVAEVNNIGVVPPYQGRGVGSALLSDFLKRIEAERGATVTLEVRESNSKARQFYSRHGFVEAGSRKGFYRDPPEDAVVMTLNLPGQTHNYPVAGA